MTSAARGAAGALHMQNRVNAMHFEDLKKERAIREKESAAPRVVPVDRKTESGLHMPPAARAPYRRGSNPMPTHAKPAPPPNPPQAPPLVVVYKRKRRLAA
jgi:hypothetical protein